MNRSKAKQPHYSRTAELMAVQRGLESCHPPRDRLLSDPLAPVFVAPRWRFALSAARVPFIRAIIERTYDSFGGPGPRSSAVARTRLIDDLIAERIAETRQFVILGAGFDCRAYRLPQLAGIRVFEIDHPDTQMRKRKRLSRSKGSLPPNVTFVPVDFERDDLVRSLLGLGYDEHSLSIWLWEGVTNYLTESAVDATLAAVSRLASRGSTLIFTYVDRAVIEHRFSAFPEAERWVRGVEQRAEPWTFGLDPPEVGSFLRARGFGLIGDVSMAEAGERYFQPRRRRERGSALYHVVTAQVASQPIA